ncbi:MAG: 4-(cytidine 5'-diphospho)-2-C-methyl-D-erythritol kinase [Wolbachia endosymbiont of Fragariocoptes setiger]|nr:4-(cytidine 5'-diphospho)-2-C-methyl-D-erythritol kinase [Wolbachia endosymbiont of Fragariocoptes setiger]
MNVFSVKAYAKINLFLHIIARKETGYHEIESLFVFTNFANFLEIKIDYKKYRYDKSEVVFINSKSKIDSRYNTIIKAINMLIRYAPSYTKVFVKVIKNVPSASGLGSGSSDAGAIIRTMGKVWNVERSILNEIALNIGSDVPASIDSRAVLVRGFGEELSYIRNTHSLPKDIVIVKLKKKFLSTPEVYSKFSGEFSQPIEWSNDMNLLQLVKNTRNDLQETAIHFIPEIKNVVSTLELQKGCVVARMSGSGVACFGLFDNEENAKTAKITIETENSNWLVINTKLIL